MKYSIFILIFFLACNSHKQKSEAINIDDDLSRNSIYVSSYVCSYMILHNSYPANQKDLSDFFDDSVVKNEINAFKIDIIIDSVGKFVEVTSVNNQKNYYKIPFDYCDVQKRNHYRQHRIYNNNNNKEIFNEDVKQIVNEITTIKQKTLNQLRENTIIDRLKTNEEQPLSFITFKYEPQYEKWVSELTQVEHGINEVNEMSNSILSYLNGELLSESFKFDKICVPLNFYRLDQYL